jgi:hypothetical protein
MLAYVEYWRFGLASSFVLFRPIDVRQIGKQTGKQAGRQRNQRLFPSLLFLSLSLSLSLSPSRPNHQIRHQPPEPTDRFPIGNFSHVHGDLLQHISCCSILTALLSFGALFAFVLLQVSLPACLPACLPSSLSACPLSR